MVAVCRYIIATIGFCPSAMHQEESYGTADRPSWPSGDRERPTSARQAPEEGAGAGRLSGGAGRATDQPRAAFRLVVAVSGIGPGPPQPAQLPAGAAQDFGPKRPTISGC